MITNKPTLSGFQETGFYANNVKLCDCHNDNNPQRLTDTNNNTHPLNLQR